MPASEHDALAARWGTSLSGLHHAVIEQRAFAPPSDMDSAEHHATFDFPGASKDWMVPDCPATLKLSKPISAG